MLTGTHPLSSQGIGKVSLERLGAAETLQSHGLSTGGFQLNPFLSEQFNYDWGFETYRDYQNPLMWAATRVFPRGIEVIIHN